MSVDDRVKYETRPALLSALLAAAFAVRIAVRIAFGQQYFWTNSYFLFYGLAERLASGHGFCRAAMCVRPPLYPLFLTPSVLAGKSFLLVVVPEAVLGCGTAWCAFFDWPRDVQPPRRPARVRHHGLLSLLQPLAQAAYAAGYVPVALLGTAGMILAARRRATVLIAMLFIAFIAVTAVFWAHTSHRTYLDVYLIVFAASVAERLWARSGTTAAADRVAHA